MPTPAPLRRSSPFRAAALAVACLALLTACPKGGSDDGAGQAKEPSKQTPEFAYEVDKITVISTATPKQPKQAPADLQRKADQVAEQMSLLMKASFLDPANWQSGDYASAWDLYDEGAAPAAEQQAAVMSAGPDAGERYTDIQPGPGHLNVKFLVDEKGKPIMTIAVAEFIGEVAEAGGGKAQIVSRGQYFLNDVANTPFIYAFDVDRYDEGGTKPTGSANSSPSP